MNLHEFFEKSKKNYERLFRGVREGGGGLEESHRLFMVSYLRLLYIFYTKISFEKVGEVAKDVVEYLQSYIGNLRLAGSKGGNFLNLIVLMILFSLHYTIEGKRKKEGKVQGEERKRTEGGRKGRRGGGREGGKEDK